MERLLKYFRPDSYKLELKFDKLNEVFGGVVTVRGVALGSVVKFHAVGMELERVTVDNAEWEYKYDGEVVVLDGVPSREISVGLWYHGKLNRNMEGVYLSTYKYEGKEERVVATQFESHYAREAFPCIDEPAAKAVFELAITVNDEGDKVLSNMPVKNVVKNTTFFEPTPRMSTYLLAWVIGKFHGKTVVNEHGVEITTYCALNQPLDSVDFANEVAARALVFFDDNFGVPYPLKKCTQVALPDFEAGAMENWGLITYRESMLLVGDSATLEAKKGVALTVAHELSHQWFGDLVTMEWWDDLWLNESFASIMEYFATDALYPDFKIWEDFFTSDCLAALKRDALNGVQSVHQEVGDPAEISTLFDSAIVYSKGARLMLMVIRLMGWENFCAGIQEYFKTYQYKNTKGDDLWRILTKHAGFNVGEMMHGFIDRPGYPVIKMNIGGAKQRRFLLDDEMRDSDWLLPEIYEDMSGHYILELSQAELEERFSRFDKLSLEEKLRLLVDRDLICRTDLESSATLVPMVMKFKHESSAAVWEILLMIINDLKVFFDEGSKEEGEFKQLVKALVEPKLSEVGLKTREDDDENTLRMRAVLMALDFYADDRENLQKLAGMYGDKYALLDAETRSAVIRAKIYLEPEIFKKYLDDYKTIADPEIKRELLIAITVPRDKAELRQALELLKKPEIVKPQDQVYLFVWLYKNPVIREEVFSWLKENWGYVSKMVGDKSLDNYPRYMAGVIRTRGEFDEWKKFFANFKNESVLKRAIEVGENEIRARLRLIASEQSDVLEAVKEVLLHNSYGSCPHFYS